MLREGVNLSHKLVRMLARPKILLASTYEEASELLDRYAPWLMGLISDVEFPREGQPDRDAGFALARRARRSVPDLPILLQSSRAEFAAGAAGMDAAFLRKYSDTLLTDLTAFVKDHFGFGDFVFRVSDGAEVGRAANLAELEQRLKTVPVESIAYHGQRNHFSMWFRARTEFALARKLRPRTVKEFPTLEDLRHDIIASIAEYRREQSESLVADFDRRTFDPNAAFFARVGSGSLGGKARGLAFVRFLLNYHGVTRRFDGVKVHVPQALVLATDVFDQFLDGNDLRAFALECDDDGELQRRFAEARLPRRVEDDLRAFVDVVHWPLAVRSSSLLEDSQYLSFTGCVRHVPAAERRADAHAAPPPADDRREARVRVGVRRVTPRTTCTPHRTGSRRSGWRW